MAYGYVGRVLRVDLSTGELTKDSIPKETLRQFLGGAGLATKMLFDEAPRSYEAIAPGNPLIFMTGPLTGTLAPGTAYHCVVAKSPLTGFAGRAHSHGFWGAHLKFAGYDGIILVGASKNPVYLSIDNDKVNLVDASHIWGKSSYEAENLIRDGDPSIKVAVIGPAGENLAGVSGILNDRGHIAARCGLGAVMGSKKLKAISVKGKNRVLLADEAQFKKVSQGWRKDVSRAKVGLHMYGTSGSIDRWKVRLDYGDLPTRNLTTGLFEEKEKLTGQYLRSKYHTLPKPCYGCSLWHDRLVELPEDGKVRVYDEPEYEDFAAWGSNLGISDPVAVTKLTDLANRYGMDSIETSYAISLAMECYEKGLLTKEDTGGLQLKWGNDEAVAKLMEKIARRSDWIGNALAHGPAKAAEIIGKGAHEYAVHIKGMAIPMHDIRSCWGWLLGYTVAAYGPVHEGHASEWNTEPAIGYSTLLPRFDPKAKAEIVRRTQAWKLFIDSVGICWFNAPSNADPLLDALHAATGWIIDLDEALAIGERIANVARAYNLRNGLTPADDWPSRRLLTPPPDGGARGMSVEPYFKEMLHEYYGHMGWDVETGKPSRHTLERLGLSDLVKDLWPAS